VSPRTGGSKTSQKSSSPVHTSPRPDTTPNANTNPNLKSPTGIGVGTIGEGGGAAVPASLGGRTTSESMPVHKPSVGFREGGERGITNIGEGDEDEDGGECDEGGI